MHCVEERSCSNCRYEWLEDTGYSNYTVEGTTFTCLKGAHPDGTFDRFYGDLPAYGYAKECPTYLLGTGLHHDVDGEWSLQVSAEDQQLLDEYKIIRLIT